VARLDDTLDRIEARGADGLGLRVGEVPVVLAAGQRVAVKPTPLTEDEWRLRVREVAPSELAPRLDRRQACAFDIARSRLPFPSTAASRAAT
jgi:hypothetical protein